MRPSRCSVLIKQSDSPGPRTVLSTTRVCWRGRYIARPPPVRASERRAFGRRGSAAARRHEAAQASAAPRTSRGWPAPSAADNAGGVSGTARAPAIARLTARPAGVRSDAAAVPANGPRQAGCPPARETCGRPARPASILRANPCPEVTDRVCRVPLPTLFHVTRGCSPRRPAADTRYEPASETTEPGASAGIFTVRGRRPVHRRRPVLLATTAPISAPYAFQGCSVASTEKTTLHGSSAGFSGLVVESLRRVVRTWQVNVSYSPGPGILTGFPFAVPDLVRSLRSRLDSALASPPPLSRRARRPAPAPAHDRRRIRATGRPPRLCLERRGARGRAEIARRLAKYGPWRRLLRSPVLSRAQRGPGPNRRSPPRLSAARARVTSRERRVRSGAAPCELRGSRTCYG